MRYRPAEPRDLPTLARIRSLEWGEADYWHRWINGYLNGLVNPQKARRPRACFVAEREDVIVGFVAGHLTARHDCGGELQWITVVPDERGEQIGSALLREIAAWFDDQGSRRICVDVEPDNTVARAFYMRHGAIELNRHWMVWEDIFEKTSA